MQPLDCIMLKGFEYFNWNSSSTWIGPIIETLKLGIYSKDQGRDINVPHFVFMLIVDNNLFLKYFIFQKDSEELP